MAKAPWDEFGLTPGEGDPPAPPAPAPPAPAPAPPAPAPPAPDRSASRAWGIAALVLAVASWLAPPLAPALWVGVAICLAVAAVVAAGNDTAAKDLPFFVRAPVLLAKAVGELVSGQPAKAAMTLAQLGPADWLWLLVLLVLVASRYAKRRVAR